MRILFVEPYERTLFSFRKELLDNLIDRGHEIILCLSLTQKTIDEYKDKVFALFDVPMDLKNKSIFKNASLKHKYKKIISRYQPDLIFSYTIKPNIYCGFYAKNIPMVANITGLGSIFKKKGLLSSIGLFLYKASFKNVQYVFFQNNDSYDFFKSHHIPINNYRIIPGSGVNLNKFKLAEFKTNLPKTSFLFASRAIKEKGFELLIEAIPNVVKKNPNVHFNFLIAEEDLLACEKAKIVFSEYKDFISVLERTDDMPTIYAQNDFLVLPSFYKEGISNVLIESLASGRPIITTCDNPGCMEVLVEGKNGFGVKSNNLQSLEDALIKASYLDRNAIKEMGFYGREFVSQYYDRKIVINNYLEIIDNCESRSKDHQKKDSNE